MSRGCSWVAAAAALLALRLLGDHLASLDLRARLAESSAEFYRQLWETSIRLPPRPERRR